MRCFSFSPKFTLCKSCCTHSLSSMLRQALRFLCCPVTITVKNGQGGWDLVSGAEGQQKDFVLKALRNATQWILLWLEIPHTWHTRCDLFSAPSIEGDPAGEKCGNSHLKRTRHRRTPWTHFLSRLCDMSCVNNNYRDTYFQECRAI